MQEAGGDRVEIGMFRDMHFTLGNATSQHLNFART